MVLAHQGVFGLGEEIALNESAFFVLEMGWSTTGAQEFPFGVVVVGNEAIEIVLSESNVFYLGGPSGGEIVGFRAR